MKSIRLFGCFVAVVLCASNVWAQATDSDVDAIAASNNAFGLNLYAQISPNQNGNFFYSPYSISTALAMTYDGARGNTATQMADVLQFTFRQNRVSAAFATLSDDLDAAGQKDDSYDLALANAMFVQSGFTYSASFAQTLTDDYGAKFKPVDFAGDPAGSTDKINNFVANNTSGLITDLFPNPVPNTTEFVLVNAIYFQGNWASGFDPTQTRNQSFHLDSQNDVSVPIMRQEETIRYFENDQVQIVEIPYKGGNLSMAVLLPQSVDGLADLEAELTPDLLDGWLKKTSVYDVSLFLPKFSVTTSFDLTHTLEAMGMTDAFSVGADFSGISAQPIALTDVVHQAYVNVDETGTKAAGATGVVGGPSVVVGPPPPAVFRANHPFIFLIRDNASGAILFMGRVTDPSQ